MPESEHRKAKTHDNIILGDDFQMSCTPTFIRISLWNQVNAEVIR